MTGFIFRKCLEALSLVLGVVLVLLLVFESGVLGDPALLEAGEHAENAQVAEARVRLGIWQAWDPRVLTVTGPDRPGVTTRLCAVLAHHAAVVAAMEQVVLRDQLVLGIVVHHAGATAAMTRDLRSVAGSGAHAPVRSGHRAFSSKCGRGVTIFGCAPLPSLYRLNGV